jgi:hypothetical protein
VTALAGYRWSSSTSVRVALGAVVDGEAQIEDRRFDLGAGVVGSVGLARLWSRAPWFVAGTISIGVSRVTTREQMTGAQRIGLVAGDARGGVTAGRTFGPVSPYVLARVFGGPVLWTLDGDDLTGTDTHHFQLGAGVSASVAARWTILVDVAALGERAASLGVAVDL